MLGLRLREGDAGRMRASPSACVGLLETGVAAGLLAWAYGPAGLSNGARAAGRMLGGAVRSAASLRDVAGKAMQAQPRVAAAQRELREAAREISRLNSEVGAGVGGLFGAVAATRVDPGAQGTAGGGQITSRAQGAGHALSQQLAQAQGGEPDGAAPTAAAARDAPAAAQQHAAPAGLPAAAAAARVTSYEATVSQQPQQQPQQHGGALDLVAELRARRLGAAHKAHAGLRTEAMAGGADLLVTADEERRILDLIRQAEDGTGRGR